MALKHLLHSNSPTVYPHTTLNNTLEYTTITKNTSEEKKLNKVSFLLPHLDLWFLGYYEKRRYCHNFSGHLPSYVIITQPLSSRLKETLQLIIP